MADNIAEKAIIEQKSRFELLGESFNLAGGGMLGDEIDLKELYYWENNTKIPMEWRDKMQTLDPHERKDVKNIIGSARRANLNTIKELRELKREKLADIMQNNGMRIGIENAKFLEIAFTPLLEE